MEITKTVAYLDDAGSLHKTEIDARIANFKILYKRIYDSIPNMDGTAPTGTAVLYRLGIEASEVAFEQYVEAARSIRSALKEKKDASPNS